MKHFGSLIQRHESTLSHNKYLAKESVRLYGVMSFDQSRLQLLSKQIVVIIKTDCSYYILQKACKIINPPSRQVHSKLSAVSEQ